MRRIALILALISLPACAEAPPKAPSEPNCGAEAYQHLLGQSEAALAAMTFPAGRLRVLRPGQPMTMDYSAERLNVALDRAGRIVRVYCG